MRDRVRCPECDEYLDFVRERMEYHCRHCNVYLRPRTAPGAPGVPWGSSERPGTRRTASHTAPRGNRATLATMIGVCVVVAIILTSYIIWFIENDAKGSDDDIIAEDEDWDKKRYPDTAIQWEVSIVDGDYLLEVVHADRRGTQYIDLEIRTPTGSIGSILDPDGNRINLTTSLSKIHFDSEDYENADGSGWPDATHSGVFFCDYPYFRSNLTLYIVFLDTDSNLRLNDGDFIWIRSEGTGGPASGGWTLNLIDNLWDIPYDIASLPHQ